METPPLLSCPLYRREKGLDGGVEGDVSEAGSGNITAKTKSTYLQNEKSRMGLQIAVNGVTFHCYFYARIYGHNGIFLHERGMFLIIFTPLCPYSYLKTHVICNRVGGEQ